MRTSLSFLFPSILLPLFASCATVFSGSSGEVLVTSEPPGAVVEFGDQKITTPGKMRLPKTASELRFVHEDFGERTVRVDSSFGFGWLLLDILLTPGYGASGILVDLISGAIWSLPDSIHCDFTAPPEGQIQDDAPSAGTDGAGART